MARKVPFVTNEIYHIFNRGVNKNDIFFSDDDFRRFYLTLLHYKLGEGKFSHLTDPGSAGLQKTNIQARVQILAYCFMSNHFHFLLKQLVDGGITWYLQHVTNSFSHYINTKYKRVGPLFQGRFKNIHIESDEQLLHVSRYIHLNPYVSTIVQDVKDYKYSSYPSYLNHYDNLLCDPELVLSYFKSRDEYEQFVLNHAEYALSLEKIKHHVLD